jgi:hypothetical protein
MADIPLPAGRDGDARAYVNRPARPPGQKDNPGQRPPPPYRERICWLARQRFDPAPLRCRVGSEEASIHRRHGLYIATCRCRRVFNRWPARPACLASSFFFFFPPHYARTGGCCAAAGGAGGRARIPLPLLLPAPILRARRGRGAGGGIPARCTDSSGAPPHARARRRAEWWRVGSLAPPWHAGCATASGCLFVRSVHECSIGCWLVDPYLTRHVYRTIIVLGAWQGTRCKW